jgi:hypothetical protein
MEAALASEEAGAAWCDDYYGVAYAVVGINCKVVGGGWGARGSILARCSVVTLVGGVTPEAATGRRPGGTGGGRGGRGGEDDEDNNNEAGGAAGLRGRGSPSEDPLVPSRSKELRGGGGGGGRRIAGNGMH